MMKRNESMNKVLLRQWAMLLISSACLIAQPRIDEVINSDWRFTREDPSHAEDVNYNDSYWEQVSLPHNCHCSSHLQHGMDLPA
jgi:hypothetical protein